MTPQEKEKLKDSFLAIHYEPEHEGGGTCWCGVVYSKENDNKMHITHKEQRDVLFDWLLSQIDKILAAKGEEIRGMKKNPTEDQENGLEYDEGYDDGLDDALSILTPTSNE